MRISEIKKQPCPTADRVCRGIFIHRFGQELPRTIKLFVEMAKPVELDIIAVEQLDTNGKYFKVVTSTHDWLVKESSENELRCWRLT